MEHPRVGERQLQASHRLFAAREPLRGGRAVAALELRAREDGVEPAAPSGLDQGEVRQAGGAELLDAAVGLADLEPHDADVGVRGLREHALVQ